MGMKDNEVQVTDKGLDKIIEIYARTTGIRELEQAAEHLAANALYRIEVDHVKEVVFDESAVSSLLG